MKWIIIIVCFVILVGCSHQSNIKGDWYRFDTTINQYDRLVFKSSEILEMIPAFDSLKYPYIQSKVGSFKIQSNKLLVKWENNKVDEGQINNDSILILGDKIYKKMRR
jgi:hypothetical protein